MSSNPILPTICNNTNSTLSELFEMLNNLSVFLNQHLVRLSIDPVPDMNFLSDLQATLVITEDRINQLIALTENFTPYQIIPSGETSIGYYRQVYRILQPQSLDHASTGASGYYAKFQFSLVTDVKVVWDYVNYGGDYNIQIPLLIPGLTDEEIYFLLHNLPVTDYSLQSELDAITDGFLNTYYTIEDEYTIDMFRQYIISFYIGSGYYEDTPEDRQILDELLTDEYILETWGSARYHDAFTLEMARQDAIDKVMARNVGTQPIMIKAIAHAQLRLAESKSIFATGDDDPIIKDWMIVLASPLTDVKTCICQQVSIMNYLPCLLKVGRPVVYVDKYASGTGDGASLVNAYISINLAIQENWLCEIQIKGYGESDPYDEGTINVIDCAYLQGDTNVYIVGTVTSYGSYYVHYINTKVDGINTIGGGILYITYLSNCDLYEGSISNCTYVDNCNLTGEHGVPDAYGYYNYSLNTGGSIYRSSHVSNCTVEYSRSGYCIEGYGDVTNCSVYGGYVAFASGGSTYTDCTADKCRYGFGTTYTDPPGYSCYRNSWNNYIGCVSKNNYLYGFSGFHDTYVDCLSQNNGSCGYIQIGKWCSYPYNLNPDDANVYENCTDTGNCWNGGESCDDGHCDTV